MSGMSARVGLGLRAVTSARVRGVGYNQNDVGYLGASGISEYDSGRLHLCLLPLTSLLPLSLTPTHLPRTEIPANPHPNPRP